jgi:hypothetical protein
MFKRSEKHQQEERSSMNGFEIKTNLHWNLCPEIFFRLRIQQEQIILQIRNYNAFITLPILEDKLELMQF